MAEDDDSAIASIIDAEGAQTSRVIKFYQVFYNRLPDPGGLDFWTGVARSDPNFTDNDLARVFFDAGEFEVLYGGLSTEDAVREIYQNVLGREADEAGLTFWTGLVTDPDNGFGLRELGRAFARAEETDASFDPLIRDYLGDLAEGETPPETLFDYDKPDLATTFNGSDEKGGIDVITFDGKGNAPAAASGEISVQNAQSADVMNLDDLRSDPMFQGINGAGYTVAVLDTGIALNHPAFAGRIVASQDFTTDNDGTAQDSGNHGSVVSSIIASSSSNYLGVAPEANIAALQVLTGPMGNGSFSWFEAALQWVIANHTQHNIVAVNMSLGASTNTNTETPRAGLADEFAKLRELGIVTVVAAGNDYGRFQEAGTSFTSADPNVISVGAVWDEAVTNIGWGGGAKDFQAVPGQITSFSQRATGEGIETVFAPGAFIVGAAPGGGTDSQGGTSQATPQIAGLVVLAQEIAQKTLGRRLTPEEFERLLRESGQTISDPETNADNVTNTGADYKMADAHALARAIVALGGDTAPPPGGGGGGGDVPGNTGSMAAITLGTALTGSLETTGDRDWYRIDLNANTTYQIALDGAPSGAGSLTDPFVVLRDANGMSVGSNDDNPAGGRESLLQIRPEASGTYFVEARAYQDETGSYRLTVTGPDGGGGGGGGGQPVADDHGGDTSTTSSVEPGSITPGNLEVLGDRDWFRFDVEGGNSYVINLNGGTGAGMLSDPILRLRDANGQVIGQNNNVDSTTLSSELTYTAQRSGTIYVEAGAFGNDKTGQYTVQVSAPAPAMMADIPGNANTGATLSVFEGSVQGELGQNGDTDWYRIDLTAGTRYDFTLTGAPSGNGTLADPRLQILDAQGNQVAENDDAPSGGRESALSFVPTQTGVYYASAEAYAGQSSGTYRLAVLDQAGILSATGELVAADVTTSETLTADAPVAGMLDSEGDADWYRVELTGGTTYAVAMEGLSSGGGDLDDPLLRLLDANGDEITFDDDGGTDFDSRLFFTPAGDGTFYVSAESYAGLSSGSYTLRLEVDDSGSVAADTVPDDTASEATVEIGTGVAGTIEFVGDADWFRTSLVAGEAYDIRLEGETFGGGTLADPVLTVFDLNGNEVASDDDGAGGFDSALVFSPSYTGTYFVAASSFESSGPGTYTLSISGDATVLPEDSIAGSPATDLFLDRGFEAVDAVDYDGDEDWFAVDLFAGDEIIFSLDPDGASGTPLTAPRLVVYDELGQPVEGADADQLTFIPEEDALYFVSATSADGSAGGYRLGMAYAEDEGFLAETEVGAGFLGAIDFEDDFDWIAVDLAAGTYDISVTGDEDDQLEIGFEALEDPIIALYDTRGRLLAFDDAGEPDLVAGLSATIEEDGTYFVEIGSASFAAEVSYELLVS